MDWLDQQNDSKDFPDFGEECEIQKMENLQNMPNLSGVNQDGTMARYMIQARVIYKERKREHEVRKRSIAHFMDTSWGSDPQKRMGNSG